MVQEVHYKISWRARGHYPGHHKSAQGVSGQEFRGHAPLLAVPDPRRLDVHASLRDPFEQWVVRVFRSRASVPVYLVADVSASMGFDGNSRKLDVLADIAGSLGYSAYRAGDSFGFIACDESVRTDLFLPPSRSKGAGMEIARKLRELRPAGKSAAGMGAAAGYLAKQRSLVFLVSDFHFSLESARALLATLSRHEVVPVVLWDRAEFASLPRFGFAVARDAESGVRRTLFLREAFREKILAAFARRRAQLSEMFLACNARPLFLERGFDADTVTGHFFDPGRVAAA